MMPDHMCVYTCNSGCISLNITENPFDCSIEYLFISWTVPSLFSPYSSSKCLLCLCFAFVFWCSTVVIAVGTERTGTQIEGSNSEHHTIQFYLTLPCQMKSSANRVFSLCVNVQQMRQATANKSYCRTYKSSNKLSNATCFTMTQMKYAMPL